jgi:hypothetical protein
MPRYNLPYNAVTARQLMKCINWCKRKMNLRDWDITLKMWPVGYHADCHGLCEVDQNLLQANVNISRGICKAGNVSMYQVVIHEMLHVVTFGKTKMGEDSSEIVSQELETIIAECYLNSYPGDSLNITS